MDKRPARSRTQVRQRAYINVREICALLRKLEYHRSTIRHHQKAIAAHTTTLQEWLEHSDEFAAVWGEFTAAGGVTGDDFELFVAGRWQPQPVEQHQHLRLVADNTIKRRHIGSGKPPPKGTA